MYKDNNGLIAVQNRDKRMAFENALKSYSALISGVNGDTELLQELLGQEYDLLLKLGFTQFCYKKTEELYGVWGFPSMPIQEAPKMTAKEMEAWKNDKEESMGEANRQEFLQDNQNYGERE